VRAVVYCPECHAEVDIDETSFEEGEVVECSSCGVLLEVIGVAPFELEAYDMEVDDALDLVDD
jgi:lysine biosynthesis protein LysW